MGSNVLFHFINNIFFKKFNFLEKARSKGQIGLTYS